MPKIDYDNVTESHLAKKYNDVLYDLIMRCNVTGFIVESTPHFDSLQAYFAAVYVFYRNTFMLFYNIDIEGISLAKVLITKMRIVKKDMLEMKRNTNNRSNEAFEEIVEACDLVHMRIMDGLQKRHMLVRIGESEPRGEESVFHWDEKESFKKGGMKAPPDKIEIKEQVIPEKKVFRPQDIFLRKT